MSVRCAPSAVAAGSLRRGRDWLPGQRAASPPPPAPARAPADPRSGRPGRCCAGGKAAGDLSVQPVDQRHPRSRGRYRMARDGVFDRVQPRAADWPRSDRPGPALGQQAVAVANRGIVRRHFPRMAGLHAPRPGGRGSGGGRTALPGTAGPCAASAKQRQCGARSPPGCAASPPSRRKTRRSLPPCRRAGCQGGAGADFGLALGRCEARRQQPRPPPPPCRGRSALRALRRPRPGTSSDSASSRLVLPLPFGPYSTLIRAAGRQVSAA